MYSNGAELNFLLQRVSEDLEKERSNAHQESQFYEGKLQELETLLRNTIRERDVALHHLSSLQKMVANDNNGSNTIEGRQQQADQGTNTGEERSQPPDTKPICSDGQTLLADNQQGGISSSPRNNFHWENNGLEFLVDQQEDCKTSTDPPVEFSNLPEQQHIYEQQQQQEQQQLHIYNQLYQQRIYQQPQPENNVVIPNEQQAAPARLQTMKSAVIEFLEAPLSCDNAGKPDPEISGMAEPGPDTGNQRGHYYNNYPFPVPFHLPAPPEADMEVLLSGMPEKGKFLDAVVRAGPLLKDILFSGPLPKWTYPPPEFDHVEGPNLAMEWLPNPFDLQYPFPVDPYMQPHVTAAQLNPHIYPAYVHPSQNHVPFTTDPSGQEASLMYQHGGWSSSVQQQPGLLPSADFRPRYTTMPPNQLNSRHKLTKFRPLSKPSRKPFQDARQLFGMLPNRFLVAETLDYV